MNQTPHEFEECRVDVDNDAAALDQSIALTWRKTTAAIEHDVETLIQISRMSFV